VGQKVAVIGAGPSGLATVKELLAEGHEPTCFDRAAGIGGVFRFDEHHGVVWESCRLTSSGLLTAFSDFPVAAHLAGHMTVGEYVDYLRRYAEAFGVLDHVHCGVAAQAVERREDGGWRVVVTDADGTRREDRFDAVAVCSGLNQTPHFPAFRGRETFTGAFLHASGYRRPAQVAGKRVLVVGAGESGADLVAEVAAHADATVLSLRRGVAVLPRMKHGMPDDYLNTRINNSAAHWVFKTHHPDDTRKRLLYQSLFFPLALADKIVRLVKAPFQRLAPLAHLLPGRGGWPAVRLAQKTRQMTAQLLAESGGILTEQFGTKSDDFVKAIVNGQCRRAPAVDRFDGRRVWFADGSHFEPDLVILCTGFEARATFLDDRLSSAARYQHAFVPDVGASLAFIGFVRPAFGAIPPVAELQARLFARVLGGHTSLPAETEMRAWIDHETAHRAHVFRPVRGRLNHLVDFTSTCDELASLVGCKPTRAALAKESRRFRLRFYGSPFVAAQYRMVGPHAAPAIARQVIEGLPIASTADALASYYMRWRLTRVLARLFGPEFAPNLAVD
jgi:dimethylaniline monooxygenase (N-oxide forming)